MAEKWGPHKAGLFHNYGLSIVLGLLFLLSWVGQGIFQWQEEAEVARLHHEAMGWTSFLPVFASATFENWQSEFLQLFTFIVLTTVLFHKNSPESRDGDDEVSAALVRIEKRLALLETGGLSTVELEEQQELRHEVEQSRHLHRERQSA